MLSQALPIVLQSRTWQHAAIWQQWTSCTWDLLVMGSTQPLTGAGCCASNGGTIQACKTTQCSSTQNACSCWIYAEQAGRTEEGCLCGKCMQELGTMGTLLAELLQQLGLHRALRPVPPGLIGCLRSFRQRRAFRLLHLSRIMASVSHHTTAWACTNAVPPGRINNATSRRCACRHA